MIIVGYKDVKCSNVFITADLHLGHTKCIGYDGRPFESVEQMDSTILDNLNEVVKANDILIIAGDFAWKRVGMYAESIVCKNKILLLGNHDDRNICRRYFSCVENYLEIKTEDNLIVISHYPFELWNKSHYGSIHLHGHEHGLLESKGRRKDIGVTTNNYYPYKLTSLVSDMRLIPIPESRRQR